VSADHSEDPIYEIAGTPFFEDGTFTLPAIEDIVRAEKLVIYVGAGLTIDLGGPTWNTMLDKMSQSAPAGRSGDPPDQYQALAKRLAPVERATMLSGFFREWYGDTNEATTELHQAIADAIYPVYDGMQGRLSSVVALMVVVFAAAGREVTVVTTNYDTLLESEISEFVDTWNSSEGRSPVSLDVQVAEARSDDKLDGTASQPPASTPTTRSTRSVTLRYLHGRLVKGEAGCVLSGDLVFDESDYAQSRAVETEYLAGLLRDRTLLTLGASITDVALVDALSASATTGSQRYAVIPVNDLTGGERRTEKAVEFHKKAMQKRCGSLGLTPLFPDFYYQVSVFVSEIVRCLATHGVDWKSHKQRLIAWSECWLQENGFGDGISAPDREELWQLHAELEDVAKSVADGYLGKENIKVELWARWVMTDNNGERDIRQLRLCSSSTGIVTSDTTRRTSDLSVVAQVPVMIGYCAGRPTMTAKEETKPVGADEARKSLYSNRWHARLIVPVIVPFEGSDLAVGAVELSSMSEDSKIAVAEGRTSSQLKPSELRDLVKLLREMGTKWLTLNAESAPRGAPGGNSVRAVQSGEEAPGDAVEHDHATLPVADGGAS
jgi:hypothetical protein